LPSLLRLKTKTKLRLIGALVRQRFFLPFCFCFHFSLTVLFSGFSLSYLFVFVLSSSLHFCLCVFFVLCFSVFLVFARYVSVSIFFVLCDFSVSLCFSLFVLCAYVPSLYFSSFFLPFVFLYSASVFLFGFYPFVRPFVFLFVCSFYLCFSFFCLLFCVSCASCGLVFSSSLPFFMAFLWIKPENAMRSCLKIMR